MPMTLMHLGRLILVGIGVLLTADGLALLSAREFPLPRLLAAFIGAIVVLLLTRQPLRQRFLAAGLGIGAIAGTAQAVRRIAAGSSGFGTSLSKETLTIVICALYLVAFLRLMPKTRAEDLGGSN